MGSLAEYVPLCTNTAGLVALPTVSIPVGSVIKFVDDTTNAEISYWLQGNGGGLLPSDYDAATNNKSWYEV
jgi:hypothetical protein